MRFDPSVENKYLDIIHIYFKFGDATSSKRIIFFKRVETEFEIRKCFFEGGQHQMVINLK